MPSVARPSLVVIACNNSDKTVGPRKMRRRDGSRFCRCCRWKTICRKKSIAAVFLHGFLRAPSLLFSLSLSLSLCVVFFSLAQRAPVRQARVYGRSSCLRLRCSDKLSFSLQQLPPVFYDTVLFLFSSSSSFLVACRYARVCVSFGGIARRTKRIGKQPTTKKERRGRVRVDGWAKKEGDKKQNPTYATAVALTFSRFFL